MVELGTAVTRILHVVVELGTAVTRILPGGQFQGHSKLPERPITSGFASTGLRNISEKPGAGDRPSSTLRATASAL